MKARSYYRRRRVFNALIVGFPFAVVAVIASVYLHHMRIDKEQQYLAQYTAFLGTAYKSSVHMHKLATEIVYQEVVNKPEILDILERAEEAKSDDERNVLRGALYRALYPAYQHLVASDVRQFQFVSSKGVSFLRLHQPDLTGDYLLDVRPTFRIAHTQRQPTSGFEAGKLISGFRFVYPISHYDKDLGAVEISISFKAIQEAMNAVDPEREFAFVIHRALIEPILFQGRRHLYTESAINPDFLVEDPLPEIYPSPTQLSPLAEQATARLRSDKAVQTRMANGETFSTKAKIDERYLTVSFVPTPDVTGRLAGYVISYARTPILGMYAREYLLALAVTLSLLLIAYGLVLRLVGQGQVLANQRNRLNAVTQTMADGLYVLDESGRAIYVNRAAAEMVGIETEELLGKVVHDLFHAHLGEGPVPLRDCPIFRTVQSGQTFEGEERFRHKNGILFPVLVTSVPLMEDGTVIGTVTVFRDITGQKRNEKERDLFIAALQKSKDEISRLSEVSAHHLQEPVRRILLFAQRLQRETKGKELSEQGLDHINNIVFDAHRIRNLVRDMQLYLSIEDSLRNETDVDLERVVRALVKDRESAFAKTRTQVSIGALPCVHFNETLLSQLIAALIDNAIAYQSKVRDLILKVDAKQEEGRVVLRITDNGTGIPNAYRERVFQLFERLDSRHHDHATGLGLAIARRIVESRGGNIAVADGIDGGVQLVLDLPAARDAEPSE